MAKTTQEKKTFKWGDNEYLLDDLLKLHSEQEHHYYNFARDRGQYDDVALAGLRAAINNRIQAVKEGKTFEGDGVLDSDTVDNTRIQTQKKGLFKKAKYVDQDNTEWAKYYLSKLVGQLTPHTKDSSTDKGSWNMSKHGLAAYLTGQGLNAKDVFENYDLRDKVNPSNTRAYTQRRDLLKKQLAGYKTWLAGKGFDFTQNDNEWDDSFISDLDDLIANFDAYDNNAITARLRKLGAGEGYTTAFTSDRWDLSKTQEELDAEASKKKDDEAKKQEAKHLREWEDYAYGKKRSIAPIYHAPVDLSNHDFGGKNPEWINWYGDLNAEQQQQYGTYLGRDEAKWKQAWDSYMNALRTGSAYEDKNARILLQGTFINQPHGFIDLGDGKYLIRDSVNDDGQGIVYDPQNGYTATVFLGDLASKNSEIKDIYKQLAYKYINQKHGTNYTGSRNYVFKEGGELLPKHQYGNQITYNWADSSEAIKQKAEKTGLTPQVQADRDRYIDGDNKSVDNPNAGFSGAEIARLASIGADITSMFLTPVVGTVVGLGSTLTNFGADIADDGFQWEDVKNLGINVGFDLLGAIPVFGDAVGTGTKITRNLVKWAPRVMAGLAAFQGVANFDGMVGSWKKMTSSDENAKMTVQDWRNIAQSIGLLTGGVRAVRNKVAQNNMKQAAKVDDVVGVSVRDKQSKEIKQILVDGDTAKNIRAAQGDRVKIEAELSKLEDFNGKFGDTGTLEIVTKSSGWQKPWTRVTNADGSTSLELQGIRGSGRAVVNDIYDFSRIPATGVSRGLFKDRAVNESLTGLQIRATERLNRAGLPESHRGSMTKEAVDAEIARLQGELTATTDRMKTAMADRTKRAKEISKSLKVERDRLTKLQQTLNGAPDVATLQSNKTAHEGNLGHHEQKLLDSQQKLKQAEDDLNKLLGKKRVAKKNQKSHKAAITRARAKVQGLKKAISGHVASKQQQLDAIELINKQIQAHADLPKTQSEIARLAGIEPKLQRSNHTNAYNRLRQLITDYQTNHSNIGGRAVTWDLTKVLQDAGIRNAFKSGGTLDKNKLNKFLTYAKG